EEEQRKKKEAEEAERKRQEELKRQQEEAEKKRQEELKKQQEEDERKRQEELKNQQTTSANTVQTSANTTVTVAVTTVAETTQAPVTTTEPPIPNANESGFIWPAPKFSYISSYFGYRWGTTHKGIDIGDAGIMGGSAVASQSGIVITVNNSCTHNYAKSSSCGCGGGYGNYVVISHDGTYSTLYGHLTSAAVSVGDYVNQNDVIGYIGCTGFSTGAHLHFEVWENGVKQNPLNYVSP
ncbi:MAG: peptidoglycan DD-metalloendopeptidase family protein, partial [Ruminococcus sp.]|nr:peptidoglycan DD-metalloendopeptidase family protein [Ruminococcus sp.]